MQVATFEFYYEIEKARKHKKDTYVLLRKGYLIINQ